MLFLVELDHVKSGALLTPEQGRTFIEQVIFPTLARAEQFSKDGKIVSGGAVLGRVSLRFIVEAASLPEVDQIVSSLPVWPLAETRVTPLTAFADRRQSVQALLASLAKA
ncbi:MAG TPA: muconolactone Delta-isomerase family protein [Terriglobales bacterium]|jgi:muconolactone delta-isomerase